MREVQMALTAGRIVQQVLAVKPGESLLLITDTDRPKSITRTIATVAAAAGAGVTVITMLPTEMGGVEPPEVVAAAMAAADCIINQTSHSMTHTNAQRAAVAAGARVCNIRLISEDMMVRGGVTADYHEVRRITDKLAAMLTSASEVEISTPEGTSLTLGVAGRPGLVLAGFATEPGSFAGLPDGEACIAPVEGTSNGVIVNPYMVEKLEVRREPLRLEIENGEVTACTGGKEAMELQALFERAGQSSRNIGEFAFGTNPACRLIGISREDKKKLGTVHVAVGDSKTLGGTVESYMHLDIVLLRPTVHLDGLPVLVDGQFMPGII